MEKTQLLIRRRRIQNRLHELFVELKGSLHHKIGFQLLPGKENVDNSDSRDWKEKKNVGALPSSGRIYVHWDDSRKNGFG
ncbi:hypothetical protein LguiA_014287 [Lonicera macranthoides]